MARAQTGTAFGPDYWEADSTGNMFGTPAFEPLMGSPPPFFEDIPPPPISPLGAQDDSFVASCLAGTTTMTTNPQEPPPPPPPQPSVAAITAPQVHLDHAAAAAPTDELSLLVGIYAREDAALRQLKAKDDSFLLLEQKLTDKVQFARAVFDDKNKKLTALFKQAQELDLDDYNTLEKQKATAASCFAPYLAKIAEVEQEYMAARTQAIAMRPLYATEMAKIEGVMTRVVDLVRIAQNPSPAQLTALIAASMAKYTQVCTHCNEQIIAPALSWRVCAQCTPMCRLCTLHLRMHTCASRGVAVDMAHCPIHDAH